MRLPYLTLGLLLRVMVVISLVVVFIGYILWQSRVFITGPVIAVTVPPPAITSNSSVTVSGSVENIVWIKINDRNIITTPEGDFKESVVLASGYTILELSAADRFGRETILTYPIVRHTASGTITHSPY